MKEMWNERYSEVEYVYGENPNEYLKEKLMGLEPGKILFPAEGEGRNAVFAAKCGWEVFAFDYSIEGKKKADILARKNNVEIIYDLSDFNNINYSEEQFDAIAMTYAHFAADKKIALYRQLDNYLSNGGFIIFEAFSKNHLAKKGSNENVGGPGDIDMLFSIDEIKEIFTNYQIYELYESDIKLNEGKFHSGNATVIRFFGEKKGN